MAADKLAEIEGLSGAARQKALQSLADAERKGWHLTRTETWNVDGFQHVVMHFEVDENPSHEKTINFEVPSETTMGR